jgi:hemoglobin
MNHEIGDEPDTLFERVGGREAVNDIVDSLYARVLSDQKLNRYFEHTSTEKVIRIQKEFVAAALDGPVTVSDIDLTRIHQGLGITRRDVSRFVDHLIAVLDLKHHIKRNDAMQIIARIATYSDQITGGAGGEDG